MTEQELRALIVREIDIGMHERAVASEENRSNPGRPPMKGPTNSEIADRIIQAMNRKEQT